MGINVNSSHKDAAWEFVKSACGEEGAKVYAEKGDIPAMKDDTRFRGRDVLFLFYVATIAIPWQVYMLPQYSMMNKLHLVDSHLGYLLMQSFIAFGVFLMRQFFMTLPNELLEAGRIGGLSEYGNYFRIALPLSRPSVATLTIFSFVAIWNDYMGPMIYFIVNDKIICRSL